MNRKYTWILMLSVALIMVVTLANHKPGELVRKGPYEGMVYIPGGTFVYGHSGPGLSSAGITQPRQITITPFYMDHTEVTNAKYREFVQWVRDSIAIKNHGLTEFEKTLPDGQVFIDWVKVNSRRSSLWRNRNSDPRIQSAWEALFYQGQDQIYGRNEYNVRLFRYDYDWYDLQAAIANRNNPAFSRSDYIRRESTLIYPDTTVWIADFSYSQNEPMVRGYFSHVNYSDYPVVGVSWKQAEAYNHWRTKQFEIAEANKSSNEKKSIQPFTLPSEADWQYAATANAGSGVTYPWGSHSARHGGGFLNANFKPGRGNYVEDGYPYTSPIQSYYPNDFGLYDMAGNVAEWTSDTYDESASIFVHDLNPFYKYNASDDDPNAAKRKVVKGGSWKDTQDYIAIDSRTYEYQDSSRSFIGFRSINRP